MAFAVLDTPDALQTICDLISAKYGQTVTPNDVVALGTQILTDEQEFNKAAGFTKVHDQLPRWFRQKLPPHDVTWDFSADELQAAKV